MKKYLVIIIFITIGVFTSNLMSGEKLSCQPKIKNKGAYIKIVGIDGYDLDWNDVFEILLPFARIGCEYVEINDFHWNFYYSACGHVPYYEESDLLILKKNVKSNHSSSVMPCQDYELELIKTWCKQHKGKHAVITFGHMVKFNTLRAVIDIFCNQGLTYSLSKPDLSADTKAASAIRIELNKFEEPKERPPKSSLSD